MTLTVDVPEKISVEAYSALIRTLGFDPSQLRSLEFHFDGIHAEVYAVDTQGRRILRNNSLATHKVFIPVVDV